jgi:hypothetical protein
MFSYLRQLQKQPADKRRMYAVAGATSVTALCAIVWLTFYPPIDYNSAARPATSTPQQERMQQQVAEGAPPFQAIGTALAEAIAGAQAAISGLQSGDPAPITGSQE